MKKRIRFQGTLIFFGVLVSLIFSKHLFHRSSNEAVNTFFDVLGLSLILTGFLFRITARGYKKDNAGQGTVLVTQGPYVLVRNPMYLGTFLIGSGIVVAVFAWWVLFIFWGIFLGIYIPQVRREEEALTIRFGAPYQAYLKSTPKFFPSFKSFFSVNIKDVLGFRRSWIRDEKSSLVAVVGVFLGFEFIQKVQVADWGQGIKKLVLLLVICVLYVAFLMFLEIRKRKVRK